MNLAILKGNIGADPELKHTQSGKAILKFSLATSETWKDRNGVKQEKTEWHRVVFFDKRAEGLAKCLSKGSKVLVTGKIAYGSYEKDGVKHYTTDIHGRELEFCGDKKPGVARTESRSGGDDYASADGYSDAAEADAEAAASANDDDSIPF